MANYNLTNQAIEDSFEPLLQIDSGSFLRDGTGSLVDVINATSSYALVAEVALNASASQNWNDITNKPSGLVSGSIQVSDITGSSLITASNDFSEITFTKGDGSQFTLDTTPRIVQESVKNGNGQTLLKGTPVYASGSVGNAQLVFPASASNDSTMPAVYILAQELEAGEEGFGITHGFINGVNTSLFAAGDEVYVGSNGGFTNQRPTGSNLIQKLGTVVRSNANNGSGVIQIDSIVSVPNIQQGYTWVGDINGVAQPIPTSSIQTDISGLVTTSSFNQYTSSTDARLNSIELETSSLDTRVTSLENFSSSLDTNFVSETEFGIYTSSNDSKIQSLIDTTSSLLLTASFDNNTRDLTFTKVDSSTFALNIPAQSGSIEWDDVQNKPSGLVSGSSQLTGSFVTTNTLQTITAEKRFDDDIHIRSTNKLRIGNFDSEHYIYGPGGARLNIIGEQPNSNLSILSGDFTRTGTSFTPNINIKSKNIEVGRINLETINFNISASNTIITGSVDIKETFTSSLQEGYILVGNSSNRTSAIPTSSLVVNIDTGSLLLTASFDNNTRDLTFTKADNSTFALNIPAQSGSALTGSYVTTGSFNEYTSSNDSKVNSLIAETSSYVDLTSTQNISGVKSFTSFPNSIPIKMNGPAKIQFGNWNTNTIFSDNGAKNITIVSNNNDGGNSIRILTRTDKTNDSVNIDTYTFNVTATNIKLSGSVDLRDTFTSSLQEGYILVGNSSNRTSAIPTSSLVVDIDTGSLVSTSSFNEYTSSTDFRLSSIELETASIDTRVTSLENFSSSLDTTFATDAELAAATQSLINSIATKLDTGSFNSYTQSTDIRITDLENFSSSLDATYVTETELGVVTQSLQNQIDTKLDSSSFNSFTQSYISDSSSFDTRIDSLENFSSSLDTNFVSETEFGIYTSSNDSKVNSLISATGSYATTGSNTFIGNQNIIGSLTSSVAKSNLILNPQTITENITIGPDNNAFVVGPVNIDGDVSIEGDSELYVYSKPDVIDTSSFAKLQENNLFTGLNTFTGDVIITGSTNNFTASVDTIELSAQSGFRIASATPITLNSALTINGAFLLNAALYQAAANQISNTSANIPNTRDHFVINLQSGQTTTLNIATLIGPSRTINLLIKQPSSGTTGSLQLTSNGSFTLVGPSGSLQPSKGLTLSQTTGSIDYIALQSTFDTATVAVIRNEYNLDIQT